MRRAGGRFIGGFALAGSVGVWSADGVTFLGLQQIDELGYEEGALTCRLSVNGIQLHSSCIL